MDFSEHKLVKTVNGELCNQLGNLLSRAFTSKFLLPFSDVESEELKVDGSLIRDIKSICQDCASFFDDYNFGAGLERLQIILRNANSRFSNVQPWRLASGETEPLRSILGDVAFSCISYALMASPVIPSISERVFDIIGAKGMTLSNLFESSSFEKLKIGGIRSSGPMLRRLQL